MGTLTFDTYKVIKGLEAAGLPTEQAKAVSDAVQLSHESADLATKGDLQRELSNLRTELKLEMSEIKSEQKLMKWMLGAVLAIAISIALKLFLH